MSSPYSSGVLESALTESESIEARIAELEQQKKEHATVVKRATEDYLSSPACLQGIRDIHSTKNGVYVVPQTCVDMLKRVFKYTRCRTYNEDKISAFIEKFRHLVCGSEIDFPELGFLNFDSNGQTPIAVSIYIRGKWKTFFHIFEGAKSEHEIFSEGSRFSHDLSKFELKSHDVYRDGGSYKKTYKSVSFILIFDYNKSTNITTFKAIPIKSSTPVLPGISVDVVDTQQFRGGGGSGRGR